MDNIDVVWDKFFGDRSKPLPERFPGKYRSLVVETNDPLNMGRIRFKCPELHDDDLKPDECPWAVCALDVGGKRTARFVSPSIGDVVWITFEKNHPYGPIWDGYATPTRRKFYTYPQIHNISPIPVDENGIVDKRPVDYDRQYLPKDGRPMAHGWTDRYGNLDIHSSVGFYPIEHDVPPPEPDHDAVSNTKFLQRSEKPIVNDPDKKYMARITKYGHMLVMGDQGFHWKKEEDLGEFKGDFKEDEKFEIKRWLYLQKLLNDNVPKAESDGGDQRKILLQSRYGTKLEIRDVGWAQKGPIMSKSRLDEYEQPRILSKEENADYRWFKIRTKGGMLFQAYDKGFHPAKDKFIQRTLLQECGHRSENEKKHWGDKRDARWIRIVTRYGLKFVLDDRGSDEKEADKKDLPRGVGIMLKGRRTPAAKKDPKKGDPRGFLWEFNENDEANHTTWSSPLGQCMEINDRYQYTMIAAALGKGWVRKHQGLKENEFIRKPMMMKNPEFKTHHLKLDHDNEYIRFKTRGNRGVAPQDPANQSGVGSGELQQGFEARDGENGDGPWVEVVDCQRRGIWFSKTNQLGIWRAKKGRRMYQWFDDAEKKIVIYNNESSGKIEIYANQEVNLISTKDVNIRADGDILMKAAKAIKMQAGGVKLTLYGNISTNVSFNGPRVNAFLCGAFPGPGAGCPNPGGDTVDRIDRPELPKSTQPKDRGKTYNGPFEECPENEVEHEIRE